MTDASSLFPDLVLPADLLQTLLDVSLTGVILFRPVYSADGDVITDFAYVRLNPAAQRMLRQPECPTRTFRQLYPHAMETGIFAFYRDTFLAGKPGRYNIDYTYDGLDNYFHLAAQRTGPLLLVSFTDTADHGRTNVETTLRESQLREQTARAEAEAQRQQLHTTLMQAPAMICIFSGPEHVFELANPSYQRLVGERPLLGRPIREAMPELADQPVFALLDEVYRTGIPFLANEMLVQLDHDNAGPTELEKRYYNLTYQPRRDAHDVITGILVFANDVTPQVHARRHIEESEKALAATNHELQATNDELFQAERQLRELNEQLELRVHRRTEQLRVALHQTEQQREQVRSQEKLLQQILSEVPACIATLTEPDHRFSFFNDRYNALVGGRAHLGRPSAEALAELVEQGFITMLDQVYATGQPFSAVEAPIELHNAASGAPERRYLDFVCQPLHNGQGKTQGILFFIIDTTEKVLARRQVEAYQNQLQTLFEQAPVAIIILRVPEYVVEVANAPMCAIWGGTPAQLLGHPVFEVLPETLDQGFKELLDSVAQTGVAFAAQEVATLLERQGQLETVYLNFVYQPLRDPDGRITSIAAVGTEVTGLVRTRRQLEQLTHELAATNATLHVTNIDAQTTNDELTRVNADLDNFIYIASHDLRAPILNIDGLLAALEQELPAASCQAELVAPLLARMHDAIARFQKTLNHLTDITKLQKTHDQPVISVNLAAVIEEVCLDLAPQIAASPCALEVDVTECTYVSFAAKNLRSIVYNLLSNALKYRDPTRPLHVQISCRPSGEYAVLTVQDNGLGLAAARQPELFTMFKRFHAHVEGSGIGLYMVKKIVESAGGRVAVESALGVGSTFRVYLRQ